MKEEPINKKLMELAEGRPRQSREKSVDSFQKKVIIKEKSEVKEPPPPPPEPPKRPAVEEPLPTLHTESDLSDISDDPDEILDMEEEEAVVPKKLIENDKDTASVKSQETSHSSPKPPPADEILTKEKDPSESLRYIINKFKYLKKIIKYIYY